VQQAEAMHLQQTPELRMSCAVLGAYLTLAKRSHHSLVRHSLQTSSLDHAVQRTHSTCAIMCRSVLKLSGAWSGAACQRVEHAQDSCLCTV
jgi:hypothetical protein